MTKPKEIYSDINWTIQHDTEKDELFITRFHDAHWRGEILLNENSFDVEEFLEDTRDILVGYDGESTVEGLKELIDEARERIAAVLDGTTDKIGNAPENMQDL